MSTPVVESVLNVFTLLGEDGDSFLATEIYLSEDNPNSVFYYYINGSTERMSLQTGACH